MQPAAAALDSEHIRVLRSDKPVEDVVNESSFWQKNPDQVPVDQVTCAIMSVLCYR